MTNKNNNVNKPRTNTPAVAPNNAVLDIFAELMTEGVSVKRTLPVGVHTVVFKGVDFDLTKLTMTIKMEFEGNEYLNTTSLKAASEAAKTPEDIQKLKYRIQIPLEQIAKQFELQGQVTPAMLNTHIDKPMQVWAFIPEGKKTICYNFAEPYKAPVVAPASAGPVDGKDY